jgi:hypothetical protein
MFKAVTRLRRHLHDFEVALKLPSAVTANGATTPAPMIGRLRSACLPIRPFRHPTHSLTRTNSLFTCRHTRAAVY